MSHRMRYAVGASAAVVLMAGPVTGAGAVASGAFGSTTTRVSVKSNETQLFAPSSQSEMSLNGRYVAFVSGSATVVAGDTNGRTDVFLRDVVGGTTRRVSVATGGGQANGNSAFPAISDDGRQVAFGSAASNLVNGDGNGVQDIFVRDLSAGTTRRVSVSSSGAGGNGHSLFPAISGNGDVVAFVSEATNLVAGDTNGSRDVFVRVRS